MRRTAVLLAAVAVLLAGCGGEESPTAEPPGAAARPGAAAGPGGPGQDDAGSADPEPSAAKPAGPPTLDFSSCGGGFSCADLSVPLVADDPSRGTIELAVIRRPATDRAHRVGTLVVNPGGPGSSAVDYLRAAYGTLPAEVRARFDVVAFDPRGVGESAPIRCATTEQLDRYFALDPTPDDAAELAAYQRGNRELAQGCAQRSGRLLPYVSTEDAAADLERLRVALGEQKISYLGYSYGTAIGAEYVDRFPQRVRAMVLDGALDPTLTWDELLEGQSRGFDRALQAFLQDCERTRCAFRKAVEGDLLAAFDRLAARVEQAPLPAYDGRSVGPGEFSLGVGAGLYSEEYGWPALAQALADAVDGQGAGLLELSDSYLERGPGGYANVSEANLAVNCLDRPWPREVAPFLALADEVRERSPRFGPAIALSGLACASWPVPPADRPEPVTGAGAPPVVVVGTTRDPATPYEWSASLADQLRSGVLVTHEGDGHTVYRADGPDCLVEPVTDYLVTGNDPEPVRC